MLLGSGDGVIFLSILKSSFRAVLAVLMRSSLSNVYDCLLFDSIPVGIDPITLSKIWKRLEQAEMSVIPKAV